MSIRNETIALAALRGEAQLRNLYGFGWNAWAPDNTVTEFALITAEVEYEDGTNRSFLMRPGAWYGSGLRMLRVWLYSPTPGNVVLETGLNAGDFVVPSPAPKSASQYKRELYISAVAQPAGWTVESVNPGESTRLDIVVRNPNAAITLGFDVKLADADGVYRATGANDTPLSRVAAAGNLWTLLARMGRGSTGAGSGFADAGAGVGIANAMPPSRIKLVSNSAVDALKVATLEFVWAP